MKTNILSFLCLLLIVAPPAFSEGGGKRIADVLSDTRSQTTGKQTTNNRDRGMHGSQANESSTALPTDGVSDYNLLPTDSDQDRLSSRYEDRTREIRQALVHNSELSSLAKNIKILTAEDGTVFLRGQVASEAEKELVEQIAKRHISPGQLNSELQLTDTLQ